MEIRTRVIVFGSSLHLAGISVSLNADQSLEVVCIDPHSPTARQSLSELNPAAIAFDLSDPPASLDVALLCEQPGLLLIGVNPNSNELLVLSSQQERAVAVTDLLKVIHRQELEGEGSTGELREEKETRGVGEAPEGLEF